MIYKLQKKGNNNTNGSRGGTNSQFKYTNNRSTTYTNGSGDSGNGDDPISTSPQWKEVEVSNPRYRFVLSQGQLVDSRFC